MNRPQKTQVRWIWTGKCKSLDVLYSMVAGWAGLAMVTHPPLYPCFPSASYSRISVNIHLAAQQRRIHLCMSITFDSQRHRLNTHIHLRFKLILIFRLMSHSCAAVAFAAAASDDETTSRILDWQTNRLTHRTTQPLNLLVWFIFLSHSTFNYALYAQLIIM